MKKPSRTREEIMTYVTHTAGFTEQSRQQLFTEITIEVLLDIRDLLLDSIKNK